MIKFTVDLSNLTNMAKTIEKQTRFATASALSKVAVETKKEIVTQMKRVFSNPTPYALGSVYTRPATKNNLEALVWLKDSGGKGTPATKFLWAEVFGGKRHQKRHESALSKAGILSSGAGTIPGRDVKVNKYGNLSGATYTSILSYMKANRDEMQNRTAKSGKKAKGKKAAWWLLKGDGGKPKAIMQRRGQNSIPFLVFTSKLNYRKRLDFFGISKRVFDSKYNSIFASEFNKAMISAR